MIRRLAPLVLLFSAACPACQEPPEPSCPATPGDVISFCEIAQAELIVEATVVDFSTTARVLNIEAFPDVTFTPAAIQIDHALRGTRSGRLDVLIPGCITGAGESLVGPLDVNGVRSTGYFFIVAADGYAVVKAQGFFRRDGDLLRNTGVAKDGLTESALKEGVAEAAKTPTCPSADAGQ